MGFGGCQDKNDVGWWFFQGFKQGIRGILAEHVNFIDDIDLEARLVGGVVNPLSQLPDVINTTIAGGINLYHVESLALGDSLAHGAAVAWLTVAIGEAVHCFSQDTPGAGLAGTSRSAEKVGMR
jgi:hypothetical protein